MTHFTCALTGHRELPASFDNKLLYDALEGLISEGCDTFLCGMAEGFDLLALALLIELKERYKIHVEACIPFEGQERLFPEQTRQRYFDLLARCDRETVLFDDYRKGCFLARDRYMVDLCDVVLAYCTKTTGGTYYTVNYAKSKHKQVRYLPDSIGGESD